MSTLTPHRPLRAASQPVIEITTSPLAKGPAFEQRTNPGAGPESAERLIPFSALA
jgi:hypothetical protein